AGSGRSMRTGTLSVGRVTTIMLSLRSMKKPKKFAPEVPVTVPDPVATLRQRWENLLTEWMGPPGDPQRVAYMECANAKLVEGLLAEAERLQTALQDARQTSQNTAHVSARFQER